MVSAQPLTPNPHRSRAYGLWRPALRVSRAALVFAWFLTPADASAQGVLDDVRREVHGWDGAEDEDEDVRDRPEREADDAHDDADLGEGILAVLVDALLGSSTPQHDRRVHFYEYESERDGLEVAPGARPVEAQLTVNGTYLDPGFVQMQLSGALQLFSTLELAGGYELFSERVDGRRDRLGLGRVGVGLQLGSERLGVRLTPGVHYLRFDDGPDVVGGAELSARFEVLPGPVVLRFEGRTGVIGQTTTRAGGIELGWRVADVVELHVGWGGRTIGDVDLLGPRAGIKLWL